MTPGRALLSLVLITGGQSCTAPITGTGSGDESPALEARGAALAAGATCRSRADCVSEQVCVQNRCRHRTTSQAGEVLTVGARNQMEAGDFRGALETYREAIAEFEALSVPLPPDVACGAATAALRGASEDGGREVAAAEAFRCFKNSLSGDPIRVEVQTALARFRFDGLDLRLFDATERPSSFFTREPTRPTADAIQIRLDLPESDAPGFAQLRDALLQDDARRATGECFVQDWEDRHQRTALAALVLRYSNRLRDMGDYDLFLPEVDVTPAATNPEAFAVCLSRALADALGPGPRVGRSVTAWQETFTVGVSVN